MRRSGITLVEMLVALVLTLLLMAAVVNVFDQVATGVADSRSTMEMTDRLRLTRHRLQTDLANLTCPTAVWTRPESNVGYFEYIEGGYNDLNSTGLSLNQEVSQVPVSTESKYNWSASGYTAAKVYTNSALGDFDDILMFTAQSRSEPYVGYAGGNGMIESNTAEIIWYAVEDNGTLGGEPGLRTLYRRVLLVAPWLDDDNDGDGNLDYTLVAAADLASTNLLAFQQKYDLSAHVEGNRIVLNTLGDLTKRENRFAHHPTVFPHRVDLTAIHPVNTASTSPLQPFGAGSIREGHDVMLTGVLAFDVRAFDPGAPLYNVGSVTVAPGDPGYPNPASGTPVGFGAYVDLGLYRYELTNPAVFPSFNFESRQLVASSTNVQIDLGTVYDTWSFHYEHDGIDQNGDSHIDEGTDGVGDDMGERETSPPFLSPLRGVQVGLRIYEPDSRQIREVSIKQAFATQ